MRIVSFLPSATEMVYALGLDEQLVGVTHECDYPPQARNKAVVVRNVLPIETMTQAEIDRAVAERMHNGDSLYRIDEKLLRELSPDLILTQNLCQVCAPSGNEVSQVLQTLEKRPQILWLTPRSITEILDNLRDLARATGREQAAQSIIDDCNSRIDRLKTFASKVRHRPRVFCMEWLDPVYACGHWVPELVKLAGGNDELGQEAGESVRISWDEIANYSPEVIVIMPCGFNLQQTMKEIWNSFGKYSATISSHRSTFFDLEAVRNGCVFGVDANSYFARPGPRVIEGAELLAQIIHPELFAQSGIPDRSSAFQRVDSLLLQGILEPSKDYVVENGAMVFTGTYLKRRGYCCNSGCRNCPY